MLGYKVDCEYHVSLAPSTLGVSDTMLEDSLGEKLRALYAYDLGFTYGLLDVKEYRYCDGVLSLVLPVVMYLFASKVNQAFYGALISIPNGGILRIIGKPEVYTESLLEILSYASTKHNQWLQMQLNLGRGK